MQDVVHALIWVALGSAFGGPARYAVSSLAGRHAGETFPWGILIVNVSGAFAIGLLAAAATVDGRLALPSAWSLIATGFLGAYTTVSSFSLQTLALARDGQLPKALGNVVLSLGLCLPAVALGYGIGAFGLGIGSA